MMKKKIKIAPATKTGAHHWITQRISAVALIPLIIWLAISSVKIAQDPTGYMPVFFAYPFNAVMGILLISTSLYHGSLGIQVVIEDYVANKFLRQIMIMVIHFVSIATAVSAILAIARLHLVA